MTSYSKRWNLLTNKWLIVLLLLALVLAGCRGIVRGPMADRPYEDIRLNTSDGILIAADYYPSESTKGLVMLHMMGKTRASYREIAPKLADYYKIVVIDFRGHGDSDMEFTEMTDADFKGFLNDIDKSVSFLEEKGVESMSLVGASIGANAALLYAADHPVEKLVLLAPGDVYRSLDISRLPYSKPLLVQVGHFDAYASISVDDLQNNWEKARIMKYDISAHGTDLFQYDLSAKEDFLFYMT